MLNEKNKKGIFAREGGRLTHGSLFSAFRLAVLTLPPNGWDGRTCSIARLTSGAKRY